jgi:hypothetical protein
VKKLSSLPLRFPSFATFGLKLLVTWFINVSVHAIRGGTLEKQGMLLWLLLLLLLLAGTGVRTYQNNLYYNAGEEKNRKKEGEERLCCLLIRCYLKLFLNLVH